MTMAASLEHILVIIANICSLHNGLPSSIPLTTRIDKIYTVMAHTENSSEDGWVTFNRRFNALFGKDCCVVIPPSILHFSRNLAMINTNMLRPSSNMYIASMRWRLLQQPHHNCQHPHCQLTHHFFQS